jgi:hypothetical protein
MATGVSKGLWEMADIVGMLAAWKVLRTKFLFSYNNRENADIFGTAITGC